MITIRISIDKQLRSALQYLADFAEKKHIPILITAQLTRKPDQRRNHYPRITDLPYAERALRNVSAVFLLYRNQYYDIDADETLVFCSVYDPSGKILGDYPLKWCSEGRSFRSR